MVDQNAPQRLSRVALTSQIGQSGLERYGGFIWDHYDAPPAGRTWLDIYRIMSTTEPVITATLATFETLASRVMWTMQPADDTPEAQAMADWYDGCLHDMSESFQDVLSEIWLMLVYGFAPMEQTYKLRRGDNDSAPLSSKFTDGQVGWAKWSIRSPLTRYKWEFDENGDVLGMWQLAPPTYRMVFIPAEKMLLFRTTSRFGNPEGQSLLRAAYKSWMSKVGIETIERIGIERDLAGLPVAEVPFELLRSDATPEEKGLLASIFNIVTNIKRDNNEGIVWPLQFDANKNSLYNLKLLSSSGARQFDTDKTVSRYKQEMAMSMLADFLFLGHESRGSFALVQDRTKLFRDALDTFLNRIIGIINSVAIPRLGRLNGHNMALLPELTHSDVAEIDLQQLAQFLTALGPNGANLLDTADPELRKHVLEVADLPVPNTAGNVDDQAGDTAETTPQDLEVSS